ncbi:MAG: hypothetical protein Q3965_04790 [Rothia sp. (in: high G+C Gram-positive bacteria)]|nr:hypothetical protein [Rothia sp. (in: high G+C Gram-positive bacteria)]
MNRLLLSAAYLEYSQDKHCIRLISFQETTSNISISTGETIEVHNTINSIDLYHKIQEVTDLSINEPTEEQPAISSKVSQAWPNLLDDLGSYYGAFSEIPVDIPVKLVEIERSQSNARITLSYHDKLHHFIYLFDGYPAALPVSLSYLVLRPAEQPFEPEIKRILAKIPTVGK